MMNFPINSASQNKKYFITPPKNAVHPEVQKVSEQKIVNPPKKKNNSSGKIWIGLSALAAAGAASLLFFRGSTTQKTVAPVARDIASEVKGLKAKIKENYMNKKSEILKNSDLTEDKNEIKKYRDTMNNAYLAVKNKIKKLAEDSDWIDLRKVRKRLLKTLDKEKHGEKRDIASKKIEILNNILICKIYPEEEEAFKGKILMDLSDAAELVKKDFATMEDFQKEYSSRQKYDFELDLNEKFFYKNFKLTWRDLFPEDMKEYDFAKEKIKDLQKEPQTKRLEKLKQLALEFRETADVKTLKSLNAQNQSPELCND